MGDQKKHSAQKETDRAAKADKVARLHAAHQEKAGADEVGPKAKAKPSAGHACYSAATADLPFRYSIMLSAASRPSRMAQTTSDAPRTISPAA